MNGTLSYLVHDLLGSVGAALSTSGTLTAASIYGPWGTSLYSTGIMPTAKGFTGQYGDAATGLDYYGARYYDPVAAQFISADTAQGPNRYAYVGGNPETRSDPTGHDPWWQDGNGGSPTPTPTPPASSGIGSWLVPALGFIVTAGSLVVTLGQTMWRDEAPARARLFGPDPLGDISRMTGWSDIQSAFGGTWQFW